jgi:hypothetical protein
MSLTPGLLFVSLTMAILTWMMWNLKVILIYISLMTKDVDHFFMYLLFIKKYVLPIYWLGHWFLLF